jgi:hypothetical protein
MVCDVPVVLNHPSTVQFPLGLRTEASAIETACEEAEASESA